MLVFFINGNLLYLLIRSCLEPLVDSGEQDETLVSTKMIVEFRDLFRGGIWSLDHILLVTMHPGPSDCAQNNSFKL